MVYKVRFKYGYGVQSLREASEMGLTSMNRAIVRKPARSLSEGLTKANLGLPDYDKALLQHEQYCAALERCGLTLTLLEADEAFPDSTFVEDTAVLTRQCAMLTRPGAHSRLDEVEGLAEILLQSFPVVERIEEPGTLEGGDICEAGNHFFIGLSERTNEAGAEQLKSFLTRVGCTSSFMDIRSLRGLLHLKSGLAWLGGNRLVVTDSLACLKDLAPFELLRVAAEEEYAANCVRINDYVLIASGYPKFANALAGLGYQSIVLDMSEFQKLDGGLSCLSLRF
jgi:dimethylargininase